MARHIKDFQANADPQTIHSEINRYLQGEGYEYIQYDGENVFKKGSGIMSNPTFFKFSYSGNTVRMETWMKYAFFLGVYIGEFGVTGFVGSAVKGPWKKRISCIENIMAKTAMQAAYYTPASAQNAANSFNNNETQLLNNNDGLQQTCVMSGDKAETPSAVFCTGCGTQLPEGTVFCSVCGQKRPDASFQGVQGAAPAAAQNFAPNQQAFHRPAISTQPTGAAFRLRATR